MVLGPYATDVISVSLGNFYGPIPDLENQLSKLPPSSHSILHSSQLALADLSVQLKRSGSFDFSDLSSDDLQNQVLPDVVCREKSYGFVDDHGLDTFLKKCEQKLRDLGDDEDVLQKELAEILAGRNSEPVKTMYENMIGAIAGVFQSSSNIEFRESETKNKIRYLYFIDHMRNYFNEKQVQDRLQQDRILFCLFQGLGKWPFVVPQMYVGLLQALTNQAIRVNPEDMQLSLEVAKDGSKNVYVTSRISIEMLLDKRQLNAFKSCGYIETSLCIPFDKENDIQMINADCKVDNPELKTVLEKELRALQPPIVPVSIPPVELPLTDRELQAAHRSPVTSVSTQPFGYQSVGQRTGSWFRRNWLPCVSGAAAIMGGGLLAAFLLSGGGVALAAVITLGLGLVVTEAAVTLFAAGLLAVAYGAMIGISYLASKKEEPKVVANEKEMRFSFDPPLPQQGRNSLANSQELTVYPNPEAVVTRVAEPQSASLEIDEDDMPLLVVGQGY